jgi:hypothetical protein
MYDFHKVVSTGGAKGSHRYEWEFANDFFQRGRADLMDKVRRKAHSVAVDNIHAPTKGQKNESLKRVLGQIETLSARNKVRSHTVSE